MNYSESREYIQEIGKIGSVMGLDSIKTLLDKIGNPHKELTIVHFSGTNGKGSTITYTEGILMTAGYTVAKYTSPAVFHEREIIQINGDYISEDDYAKCLSKIKVAADQMVAEGLSQPTAFEMETALAFLYVKEKECDILLLETGMGGEKDATNVVDKVLCSVITTVSMDHMNILGSNIEMIAREKAGIIKEGCPVVLTNQRSEPVYKVIKEIADKKNAHLIIADKPTNIHRDSEGILVFDYECDGFGKNSAINIKKSQNKNPFGSDLILKEEIVSSDRMSFFNIKTSMTGGYQPVNAATAIEIARILDMQGFKLKEYIKKGIERAAIPGRFEIICEKPLIIIDGAHNPAAAEELRATIEMYFTNKKIAFIIGVLADKDYSKIAEITAPLAEVIITVTPDNPRALGGEKYRDIIRRYNPNVMYSTTVEAALAKAVVKAKAEEVDLIIAFGSLSYLGQIKDMLK